MRNVHHTQIEAARRYAAADKSDPFAFNRAMTHLKNGLASFDSKGSPCGYDATEINVTRVTTTGVEYSAVDYGSRHRP